MNEIMMRGDMEVFRSSILMREIFLILSNKAIDIKTLIKVPLSLLTHYFNNFYKASGFLRRSFNTIHIQAGFPYSIKHYTLQLQIGLYVSSKLRNSLRI
jgi:hypothetical protein